MAQIGKTSETLFAKQAQLEHLRRSKNKNISSFANFMSISDELIGNIILETAHKTFIGRNELNFAEKNRLALYSNEFQKAMKRIMSNKNSNQVNREDALAAVKFAAFVGTIVGDNNILEAQFVKAQISAETKINKDRGSRGGKVRAAKRAENITKEKARLLKIAQGLLKGKTFSTQGTLADAMLDTALPSDLLRTRETLVKYISEWQHQKKLPSKKLSKSNSYRKNDIA